MKIENEDQDQKQNSRTAAQRHSERIKKKSNRRSWRIVPTYDNFIADKSTAILQTNRKVGLHPNGTYLRKLTT